MRYSIFYLIFLTTVFSSSINAASTPCLITREYLEVITRGVCGYINEPHQANISDIQIAAINSCNEEFRTSITPYGFSTLNNYRLQFKNGAIVCEVYDRYYNSHTCFSIVINNDKHQIGGNNKGSYCFTYK